MNLLFISSCFSERARNTLPLIKKLRCQTDAAQDKTKHIVKSSKYFTHVAGCERVECEQAFKTVIILAALLSAPLKNYSIVPYLLLQHIGTCHIPATNCIINVPESDRCKR